LAGNVIVGEEDCGLVTKPSVEVGGSTRSPFDEVRTKKVDDVTEDKPTVFDETRASLREVGVGLAMGDDTKASSREVGVGLAMRDDTKASPREVGVGLAMGDEV
jgi:hypothetical protein